MKYTEVNSVAHFVHYAQRSSAEAGKDLARREHRAKAQCREEGQEYRRSTYLRRAMENAATYARALALLRAFNKNRPFHSAERYRYPQFSFMAPEYQDLYMACAKAGHPRLAPAIYGRIYDLASRQEEAIKLADTLCRHFRWNFGDFMMWVEATPIDDVGERLLQKSLRRLSAKAAF